MEIYEVAGLSMEDKVVGSTGEQEHWEPNFRYVDSATNTHVNFYNDIFIYYLHQFMCQQKHNVPWKNRNRTASHFWAGTHLFLNPFLAFWSNGTSQFWSAPLFPTFCVTIHWLNSGSSSRPATAAFMRCMDMTLSNKIHKGMICRFLQRKIQYMAVKT